MATTYREVLEQIQQLSDRLDDLIKLELYLADEIFEIDPTFCGISEQYQGGIEDLKKDVARSLSRFDRCSQE